ncbi:MAG: terminase family protein, partial [Anaerolineaceae bacterium]|nr:terminase family protein [Anaerolineaceae bacterium]
MGSMTPAEIKNLLKYATPEEKALFDEYLEAAVKTLPVFVPQAGPQSQAYNSLADVTGYGGSAGSGKSGLICGLALTRHKKSLIMRRESTQVSGLVNDIIRMVSHTNGYNSQTKTWKEPVPGVLIEFGSMPNEGDENRYRGRDHDLLALDELTEFRETQFRFIQAWVRTTIPGQRVRVVATMNPPDRKEAMWIVKYFAPWLDPNHPNPAICGELRWFSVINGEDVELPDNRPFVLDGEDNLVYDFDPKDYSEVDIYRAESRTFIAARVTDNSFLDHRYITKLQALPEPYRSQLLYGSFAVQFDTDPMQVIPTAWVEAAQARWEPWKGEMPEMTSMGADIARGGKDMTEI